MPHPPNSFCYVGRKTFVVIWMIELDKSLATKQSTTYVYAQKKSIPIHIK
jgi:hypothetical protein